MPPRRRSSKASKKESEERLSIAETIAGLANSIEQPTFTPRGNITRQQSCSASFAQLPSVVAEVVDGSTGVTASLQNVPLLTRSASVDGTADIASHGHIDIFAHKLQSPPDRSRVSVETQPSIGKASEAVSHNTVTTLGLSDNRETDTVGCSVFSAVLMGWNPPVLASCPSANIESVLPGEMSALSTIELGNHNSDVEVLKLPLVLEPVSDGTWLLVPMSASAAFGASVLPNTECVMTQHNGQAANTGHSGNQLSSSMTQAGVGSGSELLSAVDSSQTPSLHSLGSLGILGSYFNGSDGCSPGLSSIVASALHQQLPAVSSGHTVTDSLVASSHSISGASSSDEVGSGSSILGSLDALRNYYKRINADTVQANATNVQVLNSAVRVTSVRNSETSSGDTLQAEIPAVSLPVCSDEVVQPILCSGNVSVAKDFNIQTNFNVKHVSAPTVADESSSARQTSRVLPTVSVGNRCTDSSNKQLVAESDCNQDKLKPTTTLLTDGSGGQNSAKHANADNVDRHLPPKKRQKLSSGVLIATEENSFQQTTADDEQAADDNNKSVSVDPPDISLSEEIVMHRESSLTTSIATAGIRCQFSLCSSVMAIFL